MWGVNVCKSVGKLLCVHNRAEAVMCKGIGSCSVYKCEAVVCKNVGSCCVESCGEGGCYALGEDMLVA